ncbi:MAG: MarR family winged helix-turn-helix transcriptional regulator, partial [Chloroflexota bacterium]
ELIGVTMTTHRWQTGQELYRLLNRAQHLSRKGLDTLFLDELGVTSIQLAALLYVAEHPDCLLSDLGEGLSLHGPAITGLINRIEKKGLLVKQRSPYDGRATLVNLTAAGEDLVAQSEPLVIQTNVDATHGLTDAEVEVVMRYLNSVIDHFHSKEGQNVERIGKTR